MADPRGVAATITVPSEDPKQDDSKKGEPEHTDAKEANDAALRKAKDDINEEMDQLVSLPSSLAV